MVENSWGEGFSSYKSLWDKLNIIKSKVSLWHKSKYAMSSTCVKECEGKLVALLTNPKIVALLTNPIHSNEEDLISYSDKKKHKLSIELHHLRMVEDRCLCQKSMISC